MVPKLVDTSHYHLWTDALHARSLAQQARNKWDRGTYVRWTVATAWTVLEIACEDALDTKGIGRRFKENLDSAISNKSLAPLDWSKGVWQEVRTIHNRRKNYVHVNIPQDQLFPSVEEAEQAIKVIRNAIEAIYNHTGKSLPTWIDDDFDRGWDRGDDTFGHLRLIHKDVDVDAPDTVKIAYVYRDREYINEVCGPEVDVDDRIADLLHRLRVPVTAVRAYRGSQLILERKLSMRGT